MKWLQALEKRPMDNFETLDKTSRGPLGSTFLIAGRKSGYVISPKLLVLACNKEFISSFTSFQNDLNTD